MNELKQLVKDWGLPSILLVALIAVWIGFNASPVLGDLEKHILDTTRNTRFLHQICKNTAADKADRSECDALWLSP